MAAITRCKNSLAKTVTKAQFVKATAMCAVMSALNTVMPVLCLNTAGLNMDTLMGRIIGTAIYVAQYIGVFALIIGLIMFGLSFRNEDSEAKMRAAFPIITAAIMICIRFFAEPILTSIGISVIMPS